jgi:hypothetical protein
VNAATRKVWHVWAYGKRPRLCRQSNVVLQALWNNFAPLQLLWHILVGMDLPSEPIHLRMGRCEALDKYPRALDMAITLPTQGG